MERVIPADVQALLKELPPAVSQHMHQNNKSWTKLPAVVRDWNNVPDNVWIGSEEVSILLGISSEQVTRYRTSKVLPLSDALGKWSVRAIRKLLADGWRAPDDEL